MPGDEIAVNDGLVLYLTKAPPSGRRRVERERPQRGSVLRRLLYARSSRMDLPVDLITAGNQRIRTLISPF
jgi:hypothetical protein